MSAERSIAVGEFSPVLFALASAALVLAGCASGPTAPRDWRDPAAAYSPRTTEPAVVAPQPPVLPPPTNKNPSKIASPLPTLPTPDQWVSLQSWSKGGGLAMRRLTPAPTPTYEVSGAHGALTLRSGSQLAQWNGLELHLGFAPRIINGQPYVHAVDVGKNLQPLLQGAPGLDWGSSPVVVLDPGHGGADAGAKNVVNGHGEKEFTLDWALRLQKLLATNGWRVFLTRSTDTEIAISNRVTFAEERKANLFLCLHFNSAAPQSESGLETYCLTPTGLPSSLTRGFDDTRQILPNNAFDVQNLVLALTVHRALLQVNGNHDRGVRHTRFPGVLRGQQRPAILIEGGYLSNPREARLIADPAYRQKLAEAVASALFEQRKLESQVAKREPPAMSLLGMSRKP
jgi:N-acetylmuramoyl-L-alanine amidase